MTRTLIGRIIFIAASAAVISLAGGGMTFIRKPVGVTYLILWSVWWVATTLGRKPGKPSTFEEKRWLRFILGSAATVILTIIAPFEYAHFSGPIPRGGSLAWVGLTLFASGISLQSIAMWALRGFFTIQMGVQPGHHLIISGPYRFIRHPGYLSYIFSLAGVGSALSSLSILVALIPTIAFLVWRIKREEASLITEFGEEYRSYMKRTKRRLLPGIY